MKKPLILETKLRPPDCSRMLPRPRLVDLVRESRENLVVIHADAGYGKTTLLGQLYEGHEGPRVWYQLGTGDGDPAAFFTHLVESARRALSQTGVQVEAALANSRDAGEDRDRIVTEFIDELSRLSADPFIFCFDDFHLVNDIAPVVDVIRFLVSHLPPNCRMIICSREKPAFPLGRLRTQRQLLEIGVDQLRFTIDETGRILDSGGSTPFSDRELEAWHAATEGWPVSIVLAKSLLSPKRRLPEDVFPRLLGTRGAIAEYLAEEIWSDLDDETRRFLMASSLLETVDTGTCDLALANRFAGKSAASFLREIENRNLLTVSLESGKTWRYHPVVRQFMRGKLREAVSPTEIAGLHRRYGGAFEARGDIDLAISHYLEAGATGDAARLIETNGEAMFDAGRYGTMAGWLDGIPAEMFDARPSLAYLAARSHKHQGRYETSERLFEQANLGFSVAGLKSGAYKCAIAMAELYAMREEHQRSLEMAAEALRLAGDQAERVAALSQLATRKLVLGDSAGARASLTEAEALCDGAMASARHAIAADLLAVKWVSGDFREGLADSLRLQLESGPETAAKIRLYIHFQKVLNLYETARYQEALDAIDSAADYLGTEDEIQQLCSRFHRGVILMCTEDGDSGRRLIEGLIEKSGETLRLGPHFSNNFLSAWYRRHNLPERAIEVISGELAHNRRQGKQYSVASCLVNIGAARLHGGEGRGQGQGKGAGNARGKGVSNANAGVAELDEAFTIAREGGYQYILTQVHFHRAWMASALGDRQRALEEITVSLQLAARNEHNNFIAQEGRINPELLAYALAGGVEPDYLIRIFGLIGPSALPVLEPLLGSGDTAVKIAAITALGAAGRAGAAPCIRRGLRDAEASVRRTANAELARLRTSIEAPEKILTRRESQVLSLLAEGLSNLEISERLYISEPTVKTHVSRVFRKLGLTRRSQAAAYFQQGQEQGDGEGREE
jgi:ATP/maltotriose-dependent transcriptional regulator MalT